MLIIKARRNNNRTRSPFQRLKLLKHIGKLKSVKLKETTYRAETEQVHYSYFLPNLQELLFQFPASHFLQEECFLLILFLFDCPLGKRLMQVCNLQLLKLVFG